MVQGKTGVDQLKLKNVLTFNYPFWIHVGNEMSNKKPCIRKTTAPEKESITHVISLHYSKERLEAVGFIVWRLL